MCIWEHSFPTLKWFPQQSTRSCLVLCWETIGIIRGKIEMSTINSPDYKAIAWQIPAVCHLRERGNGSKGRADKAFFPWTVGKLRQCRFPDNRFGSRLAVLLCRYFSKNGTQCMAASVWGSIDERRRRQKGGSCFSKNSWEYCPNRRRHGWKSTIKLPGKSRRF